MVRHASTYRAARRESFHRARKSWPWRVWRWARDGVLLHHTTGKPTKLYDFSGSSLGLHPILSKKQIRAMQRYQERQLAVKRRKLAIARRNMEAYYPYCWAFA